MMYNINFKKFIIKSTKTKDKLINCSLILTMKKIKYNSNVSYKLKYTSKEGSYL